MKSFIVVPNMSTITDIYIVTILYPHTETHRIIGRGHLPTLAIR